MSEHDLVLNEEELKAVAPEAVLLTPEELEAELKAKAAELAQQKIMRAEYAKYIGDLKRKLKDHSKKKLIELVGNQAWQFNNLQNIAKQLHEENIKLKGESHV